MTKTRSKLWLLNVMKLVKNKNWAESDRLRDELQAKGIVIEDTPTRNEVAPCLSQRF